MDVNEINGLLRPFVQLNRKLIEQISIYIDLILKWNARVNLTAVRNPQDIVQRHFGESFFVATQLLTDEATESIIDLGSGAGFPGIPLAMFAPQAPVTLIESNGKKAAFLNEVVRALKLSNVTVFSHRAETYPRTADLVTFRAVENFSKSAELAVRLVAPTGRLALMIGASQLEVAKASHPQLLWQPSSPVPGSKSRVLLVAKRLD